MDRTWYVILTEHISTFNSSWYEIYDENISNKATGITKLLRVLRCNTDQIALKNTRTIWENFQIPLAL